MAAPITLAAPVVANSAAVYMALTESSGLASFWTRDSVAGPVVGSIGRFGFPSGAQLEVRVDELDVNRRVAWTATNDLDTGLPGPPWHGTTITWDLRAAGDGSSTLVLFQHAGWADELAQTELAGLTYAWAGVLRALKAYAESGVPQPIFSPARATAQ